jgi:hypothetical protein
MEQAEKRVFCARVEVLLLAELHELDASSPLLLNDGQFLPFNGCGGRVESFSRHKDYKILSFLPSRCDITHKSS